MDVHSHMLPASHTWPVRAHIGCGMLVVHVGVPEPPHV